MTDDRGRRTEIRSQKVGKKKEKIGGKDKATLRDKKFFKN